MDAGKSLTFGVTLPIVGAGAVATKWASDAAESANKVNVVFGEQAATVLGWAKDSERAFGLSEGQADSFFGSVGTMLKGFGIDMGVVPDMSKAVLGLAADLGSFHNVDTATVLDMISASFRGEYDSIQRLIPTMSAAEVQTRALAMTGKESADSLTAQEKALATYQLLLEGAGPATGDFARTQDGAANSTRIATAQIKSAGEQIGSVFLPIVSKIAGKIAEWADKFQGLDKGTQQIIIVVAGVAAALGPLLIALGAAAKAVLAINAAMALLAANPVVLAITAIVLAVAALVAGVIYAYNNFEWFRSFIDQAWDDIQQAITFAWENVIKPIWNAIVWYIQNLLIP
jgi:phage-related minor tail protein